MRASKEVSIVAFINKCIDNGIEKPHKIIKEAKSIDKNNEENVKEVMTNESILNISHVCLNCGGKLIYKDEEKEFYCVNCNHER